MQPPNCPGMTRREFKPNSTFDPSADPPRIVGVLDTPRSVAGRSPRAGLSPLALTLASIGSQILAAHRNLDNQHRVFQSPADDKQVDFFAYFECKKIKSILQHDDPRFIDEPTVLSASQQPNAIEPASERVARARDAKTTTMTTTMRTSVRVS